MDLHEQEMRVIYCDTLLDLMSKNENIICLEADLGKSTGTVPKIRDQFPQRFFDVGVAEANMIGIAAGMANEGMIPFCSSFTAFATRRCYDQLSISVALGQNAVKIIGASPGVTKTKDGATHMCFQDLAIIRAMPNMHVYCPADAYELRAALQYMITNQKPTYMQLLREVMPQLFQADYIFDPHQARQLCSGTDVTIVTTGLTTSIAKSAQKQLQALGITVDHLHYASIKPFDKQSLINSAKKTRAVVTVENQSVIGGLGSAVCEVLSENFPVKVKRLGAQDRFGEVGTLDYLLDAIGISTDHIIMACKELKDCKSE